jgi:hypothetical protein
MKRLTFKIILFLLCIEIVARLFTSILPFWYADAWQKAKKEDIGYLFIGSSRVGCAILPEEFAAAATENGNVRKAINLGRGYSTLTEHYWGLKNLSAARPGGLKGVTVFLEAPGGLLELTKRDDGWFHPQYPELLANALAISDLPQFWRIDCSVKQKTAITFEKLFASVQIVGYGKQLLMQAKKAFKDRGLLPAERGIELVIAGGVKASDANMSKAREYARQLVLAGATESKPVAAGQWLASEARSLSQLIRKEGGQMVVYVMPVSSVQMQPLLTPQGVQNRQTLSKLLAADSINMLDPGMVTSDDDFPDLWHLRSGRAAEFSRKLAKVHLSAASTGTGPPAR